MNAKDAADGIHSGEHSRILATVKTLLDKRQDGKIVFFASGTKNGEVHESGRIRPWTD